MLKLHRIQEYILRCLRAAKTATFTELRPAGVASNLFAYHLRALEKGSLIAKSDSQYFLTKSGKQLTDRQVDLPSAQVGIQITLLVENQQGDRRLLCCHYRSRFGHILTQAILFSQKKLTQKILTKPIHQGDAYLKIMNQEGQVQQHNLHHIFACLVQGDLTRLASDLPQPVLDEISFVQQTSDGHFFFERSYTL